MLRALILLGVLVPFRTIAADDVVAAGRAAMIAKLRDPDSAKIRAMREVNGKVCGEVNARNNLGGYEGFRKFFYDPGLKVVLVPGGFAMTGDQLDEIAASADRFCP